MKTLEVIMQSEGINYSFSFCKQKPDDRIPTSKSPFAI